MKPLCRLLAWAAVAAALVTIAGCGTGVVDPQPPTPEVGVVLLRVTWPVTTADGAVVKVIPAETESLRVVIDAPDMEPIETSITQSDVMAGVTAREIPVPVGTDREMLVQALDGDGVVLAAGKSTFDVTKGETVRARVVLVPVGSGGGTDPPEVQSRTFILTEFQGNFLPSSGGGVEPEVAALEIPEDAISGSLTLDVHEQLPSGDYPVVGTLILHNEVELWLIRGYYEGPLGGDLVLSPLAANPYLTSGGGWSSDFSGSILDEDLVVGTLIEGLVSPANFSFSFDGPDPLAEETASADVEVRTDLGRTLIGSMSGTLVF